MGRLPVSASLWHGSDSGLGSAGTPGNADWELFPSDADDYSYFGYSVAGRARINGDWFDDIILGAPGYYSGYGGVFVYYGGGTGGAADWIAMGQSGARFGESVAAGQGRELDNPGTPIREDLVSINGDEYADVIVGAPLHDDAYTDEGAVFIWYGSSSGLGASNNTPDAEILRSSPGAELGRSVAPGGNLNRPAVWHQNYVAWPSKFNQ